MQRRGGDGESVCIGSRASELITDAIVIDDSEDEVIDHISAASKRTTNMEVDDAGATSMVSGLIQAGGCTVFERDSRVDDWDIRGCIQLRVRTKFLKSAMACVHVFLDEVTIFHNKRF